MLRKTVSLIFVSVAASYLSSSDVLAQVPGAGPNLLHAHERQIGGRQVGIYRFQTADECQKAKTSYAGQYPADKWILECLYDPGH
jgi:hypothetical protein